MIQPIKEKLIDNVKHEVAKHNEKSASENDKYRKIQNDVENKGKVIDTFA